MSYANDLWRLTALKLMKKYVKNISIKAQKTKRKRFPLN